MVNFCVLINFWKKYQKVEIALKSDPQNEELLKLKDDLLEVIQLTKDLLNEEMATDDKMGAGGGSASGGSNKKSSINWKSHDKCMAIYRIDGK